MKTTEAIRQATEIALPVLAEGRRRRMTFEEFLVGVV